MKTIETTLGPLAPDQLGRINAHEHIILDGGLTIIKEPDFKLDSVEKAVEEVNYWKAAGGGALVDAMPQGAGRNVEKLQAVSQATGIPIIVPIGFHKAAFYLPDHWQYRYDEDTIAALLIAECTEGADLNNLDGPIIRRGKVKAGFFKVGADYQMVAPITQKLIRVAGKVVASTQIPVLVHTEMGTACHEILDRFEAVGIAPSRVQLSHVDRNADPALHIELAKRGAFLEYDTAGRVKYQPESVLIELMQKVFEAGYGSHILLGGDTARRTYQRAYGGGPGLDYLLTVFTKRLLREGFSSADVELVWHANPVRWLFGAAE